MKRWTQVVLSLTALAVVLVAIGGEAATGDQGEKGPIEATLAGQLEPAKLTKTVKNKDGSTTTTSLTMPWIADSTLVAAMDDVTKAKSRLRAADGYTAGAAGLGASDIGEAKASLGCSKREEGNKGRKNVRVNQDCSFRRQAEEDIVYSPANPKVLIAGQNDSRAGFNQCGVDWSTDGGKHWGDMIPPFRQWVNNPAGMEPNSSNPNRNTIRGGPGTFDTYDAGSDPTVAVDSQGNAFFSCIAFDVFDNESGLYVTRSPKGADGSFYFNVPATAKRFKVVEDNSPEIFHDKQFITADYFPNSPNRDNVYVTWTVFRFGDQCRPPSDDGIAGYCESPIFGSMSTDGANTWSTPELISTTSPLCSLGDFFDPANSPNACAFNQGSDPTALPNGDLVVVFNNGNTAANNPNGQQLGVQCRPTGKSTTGTAKLNCGTIRKVGDDFSAGSPLCEFGRGPEQCIPGAYIRTNDFPRIAVDEESGEVYVTWQDYQRRDNAAREWSIQLTRCVAGATPADGPTCASERTVNPDTNLDHYFPAVDVAERKGSKGSLVAVSYYRTERVPGENVSPAAGFVPGVPGVGEGDSDYAISGGTWPETPFDFDVISPVFPPPNGIQTGFNGDYSGITIINRWKDGRSDSEDKAHPIWSDTRNEDPFAPANGVLNDEDIFTDDVPIPKGKGKLGPGEIGKK